jgi:hypothetical protein
MRLKTRQSPQTNKTVQPNNKVSGPIIRGTNLQFFLARAEQARAEAEAASLGHVRERCRRSEAAWMALAERAERSEQLKADEALRKADKAPSA